MTALDGLGYTHAPSLSAVGRTYDLVKLGVSTQNGSGQLLVLITVPPIYQPLTTRLIDSCVSVYPHLTGLDLADSSSGGATMEIGLLIGSDHYWDFATGDVRRGTAGLWPFTPR